MEQIMMVPDKTYDRFRDAMDSLYYAYVDHGRCNDGYHVLTTNVSKASFYQMCGHIISLFPDSGICFGELGRA